MVGLWYMDIGCSNHLSGNKQWLIDFDSGRKTKIRYADDEYLNAEGVRNVKVKLKNGNTVLIKDVQYVPGMESSLMRVGQLHENEFSITMKDDFLKLYDCNHKLIRQSKIGSNMTFKGNDETTNTQLMP